MKSTIQTLILTGVSSFHSFFAFYDSILVSVTDESPVFIWFVWAKGIRFAKAH